MNIDGREFNIVPLANLQDADLQNANLQNANLQNANLQDADLQNANLLGADLRGANLRGANLRGANLRGADLQNANLLGANLQDADLWGADLRGANLQDADLQNANLRGADLRGAYLPSPQVILSANWNSLSDELTADLMEYDASSHPNRDIFDSWAHGGGCPYHQSSVVVQRAANFQEKKELWGKGKLDTPYNLMIRVLREKTTWEIS